MDNLIVGLGNPGKKYISTRHNIGFTAINELKNFYKITIDKTKFNGKYGFGKIDDKKVILLKPYTFMNNSGESVFLFANYYKINYNNIIVICDDINLPLKKIRIRNKGSSGGHNGLKSIQKHLHSQEFIRIRIGIGKEKIFSCLENYVLENFNFDEDLIIKENIKLIPEIINVILNQGVEQGMNKYNGLE
ncbi:MAG: aminoacyl-tRNA hydrolase [bacterium]